MNTLLIIVGFVCTVLCTAFFVFKFVSSKKDARFNALKKEASSKISSLRERLEGANLQITLLKNDVQSLKLAPKTSKPTKVFENFKESGISGLFMHEETR